VTIRSEKEKVMKQFLLLYKGPPTPPDASHEKWPEWFSKIGNHLVDRGSPMENGRVLRKDGSTADSATNLNGYSIIQAKNIDEVLRFIKDHPFLTLGTNEFTIEVFELPK
jgi:hypothetical protein